ncbi:MAG: hypothetical protein CMM46_10060 [Rhodospirillaceae bacterium]|nr:hypothetical protein [Rhodospirillaceae bacterium]|tara:strand:- start:1780 stop:1986 length:207 start_codon:yes stop_codon:yes gene_type:complete
MTDREARNAFAERAVAALTPMGPVRAQGMFGGHGLFLDDLMFALLTDGEMWLKGDDLNSDLYLAGGGR